jgi:hypothetical protein
MIFKVAGQFSKSDFHIHPCVCKKVILCSIYLKEFIEIHKNSQQFHNNFT